MRRHENGHDGRAEEHRGRRRGHPLEGSGHGGDHPRRGPSVQRGLPRAAGLRHRPGPLRPRQLERAGADAEHLCLAYGGAAGAHTQQAPRGARGLARGEDDARRQSPAGAQAVHCRGVQRVQHAAVRRSAQPARSPSRAGSRGEALRDDRAGLHPPHPIRGAHGAGLPRLQLHLGLRTRLRAVLASLCAHDEADGAVLRAASAALLHGPHPLRHWFLRRRRQRSARRHPRGLDWPLHHAGCAPPHGGCWGGSRRGAAANQPRGL
mmetsp:Transcript_103923/g.289558  ORF Transcript_103923/g.289558 Transcript_103923/m.289558 type:complete len:264 (-) Transcript_103923:747-1538(-)